MASSRQSSVSRENTSSKKDDQREDDSDYAQGVMKVAMEAPIDSTGLVLECLDCIPKAARNASIVGGVGALVGGTAGWAIAAYAIQASVPGQIGGAALGFFALGISGCVVGCCTADCKCDSCCEKDSNFTPRSSV